MCIYIKIFNIENEKNNEKERRLNFFKKEKKKKVNCPRRKMY